MMNLIQIMVISIHISTILSKRYASSSDETIENLLYYKDCQKKPATAKPAPVVLMRSPPQPVQQRGFECPFPKMCCSMTCNNECGGQSSMFPTRTDGSSMFQSPSPPHQPQIQGQAPIQRGRRKKNKTPLLPPIGGRREFGFTKERIKSLIAKDDDIRKILKDLVRVTMQKVDLVAMINARRKAVAEENKKEEVSRSADNELEIE